MVMDKEIFLQNQSVKYKLKQSYRAKKLRLAVHCDGTFVVTMPSIMPFKRVERFICDKADWILSKMEYFKKLKVDTIFVDRYRINSDKVAARKLVVSKIKKINSFYNFDFNDIKIKKLKSKWGSCSGRGNMNFNYKIIYLPDRLVEYIVAHELCHLKELNHSTKFWMLVSKFIPEYKECRKNLRKIIVR
jgi:predicted metal-dependent hydrolase